MSREEKKGWIGSLIIHAVIALTLFLMPVEETRTQPEFVEVSWGRISQASLSNTPSTATSSAATTESQEKLIRTVPVDLPERTPGFDEEDPALPVARKSPVDDRYNPGGTLPADVSRGTKPSGSGLATEERQLASSGTGVSGKLPGSGLAGGDGVGEGKSVAYSMQWGNGGTRRLLAGNLPVYPDGVNVEAQIRIEAMVTPGGQVRTMRPVQKGHIRLEEAALGEVKRWIFEPLAATVKQTDQLCIITFNFVLR